jgi:hypothetical protein
MKESLDSQVRHLVSRAFQELHPDRQFVAGQSSVPVTGKVFGIEELKAATNASLDFWLNLKVGLLKPLACVTPLWLILDLRLTY